VVVLALLLALVASARGQAQPAPQTPPRMARLTFVSGQVGFDGVNVNGGTSQPAVVNEPVLEGMTLATANDGQAEMEFEDGSVVRLTPNSALSIVKLAVDAQGNLHSRLALLHGLAYLELRSSTRYRYRVDAQGDEIVPVENSTIRVNLDQPPATIAVLEGEIHVTALPGGAAANQAANQAAGGQAGAQADATAGQTLRSAAAPGQPSIGNYLVKDGIDPDSWDQWNVDRDVAAANQAADQTTARNGFAGDQGYGWADLDANGSWYDVPGQGEIWQPDIAADAGMDGFDPYGYGDWAWTPGFGYVWASGYPWGWTPYRCGNWGYWGGFGWGWSPGASCGLYGFGGYGFRLNWHHSPPIYHGPRRPPPGPLPIHPPVPVHGGVAPLPPGGRVYVVHTINGTRVDPLEPVGGHPAGNRFALGAALDRDFPIDRSTHQPVVGTVASHAMPVGALANGARATWRPALGASGASSGIVPRSQPARPAYVRPPNQFPGTVQGAPQNFPGGAGMRPQPSLPPAAAPRYTPPPVPRYSPPPAAPRYSPPPAPPPPPPPPAPRAPR
jgi:hypothetical protein